MATEPVWSKLFESDADNKFEQCLWHSTPSTRPIVSSISSLVPFFDWACPSFPSKDLVYKYQQSNDTMQSDNLLQLCEPSPRRPSSIIANNVHQDSVQGTQTSGTREAFENSQKCVWKATDYLRKTSPFLTDRAICPTNASTEQASAITSSCTPKRKDAGSTVDVKVNTAREDFHREHGGYAISLADQFVFLQRPTGLSEAVFEEEFRISEIDVCETKAGGEQATFRGDSAFPARILQNAATSSGLSESGWTTYLDTSTDCGTMSHSILSFDEFALNSSNECLLAESMQSNPACGRQKPGIIAEDSSFVSDASSGPEQPLPEGRFIEGAAWWDKEGEMIDKAASGKRRNETALGGSQTSDSGRAKFRRLQSTQLHITTTPALEDTASSPLHSPYGHEERSQTISDGKLQPTSAQVASERRLEASDHRLEARQTLLQEGNEGERGRMEGDAIAC